MPFELRDLDNRTFDDLFAEARRRINAYVSEWTDHNESDPGITLLQLFSWLTETMLFRLNAVPDDRSYRAFLNLLGITPRPAKPSGTIVSFETALGSEPKQFSPQELPLTAPGDGAEIPFEPDADIPLIGARLGAVLVDDGISRTLGDFTSANEDRKEPFPPFGPARTAERALYLGLDTSENGAAIPLVPRDRNAKLSIYAGVATGAVDLRPESSAFTAERRTTRTDVYWEGLTQDGWQELEVSDDTNGLRKDGFLIVTLTDRLKHETLPNDPNPQPRFWIRARPEGRGGPEIRRLRYIAINAARARQWRTFANELLRPGSDGGPSQTREVNNPPILIEYPVTVRAMGPDGEERYERVDELSSRLIAPQPASGSSLPQAPAIAPDGDRLRVFQVSDDGNQIIFGDGLNARIPPAGPNNMSITYRSGGGRAGNNLRELSLGRSDQMIQGVRTLEPTSGGEDAETVDKAKKQAAGRIKALERAVTSEDFEVLAEDVGGVSRAIAVSRRHPLYPDLETTGALTLIVVPPRKGEEAAPLPDQQFLRDVSRALGPYRVLTTELYVTPPVYEKVSIQAKLTVRRGASVIDIKDKAAAEIRKFLDPLTGGHEGEGWPLGQAVGYGEILKLLVGIPGVLAVSELRIRVAGTLAPPCQDAPIPKYSLIEPDPPSIEVQEEGGRAG